MHVRSGVIAALIPVQVFCVGGCRKAEEQVITKLCGKFSFQVAGKSEASKARVTFYAANVRFRGLDFADDRFRTSSSFILGGQLFVLDGLDHYQDRNGDPPLTLHILAYSTARNTVSVQSTPCTFPGSASAFDNMKAAISEVWNIHVELESPEYDSQRSTAR